MARSSGGITTGGVQMVGTTLGAYRIDEEIGRGGMGRVYRAHDTALNRDVAIKVLPDGLASEPGRLMRFEREAQALAALNHRNIAQIYGLERSGTTPAIVMELVPGFTLSDRIAQGPIPLDEALPIARQIAEGLEAAHERGIIHRDLKPANIKVCDNGTVKLLDFGLAKAVGSDHDSPEGDDLANSPTVTTPATQLGVTLGTVAYMAPEQARGLAVDTRVDIWAFGVVVWEILTGRRLFEGEAASDVLAAVLRDDLDLQELPADVPPAVVRLVRRCLRRDVARRLRHIGDARLELDEAHDESAFADSRGARGIGRSYVAIERSWTLTTAVCRHLTRESLDPAVIGDALTYIDNDRPSNVLIVFLPGFGFGHGAFGQILDRCPFRSVAVTLYGFEETRRRRIPLPIADHLTILRLFVESVVETARPRTTVLCGFSSGADVALRMISEAGMSDRNLDGILALSPNLSLETCFFTRRVAEIPQDRDEGILDIAREVASAAGSPEAWLQMSPYLMELVRKYHKDIDALRAHGRDIVAPFLDRGACPFAGWYRAAKKAGVRLRAVFAGAEDSEQRALRQLRLAHIDHQVFGQDFSDVDIASEPDALHMGLMNPEVIERHLEEFLQDLRAAATQ